MSTLTGKAEKLYKIAKEALPQFLFSDQANKQEVIAAFAKTFALAWDDLDERIDQAFILQAFGFWLDQLAKDRGTFRRDGETDASLQARLRNLEDAVTPEALLTAADNILAAFSISGNAALVELRRDKAYLQLMAASIHCVAKANLSTLDDDYFNVDDGTTNIDFYYDLDGAGGGSGTAIDLSSAVTAQEVAEATATVINASALTVTAEVSATEAATVYVYQTPAARVILIETVTDPAFTVRQGRQDAYCDRGYRAGSRDNPIIIILPYGTTDAAASAVAEDIRRLKAGGIVVYIEVRANP